MHMVDARTRHSAGRSGIGYGRDGRSARRRTRLGRVSCYVATALFVMALCPNVVRGADSAPNTWASTGSMTIARQEDDQNSAVLLPNGQVLVAGGIGPYNISASSDTAATDLYNPSSGTWTATANMTTARVGHTTTLLTNGKVLVAGGSGLCNPNCARSSAELYDPAARVWTLTGSMATRRYGAEAVRLPDGKVLVMGGGENTSVYASAELYDPSTGTWTPTGSMISARIGDFTATLLPTGKVLVTGGSKSAELYDPNSGSWTPTGSRSVTGDSSITATLLPNGKVLVAGGYNGSATNAAELYDLATGLWSATGSMTTGRQGHTAVLLPSGQVLVAGGYAAFNDIASAELYDLTTGAWTATGGMTTARYRPYTALLLTGQVLVAGGRAGASAEVYTPGPFLSVELNSIDFGDRQVGATSPVQTVTLTNTGSTPVTVNSIALMGYSSADFAATDTCTTGPLAPNATCVVRVAFAPTAAGYRSASLTITDNAAGSPRTIFLTGNGIYPVAMVGSGSVNFGSQPVGLGSVQQTIVLTSAGIIPLSVKGITLTGPNAGDFTTADTCTGAPIVPASTCAIRVSFTPNAAGSRVASVLITDDAADSPQTIPLSGTGVYPVVSLNPGSLDFADQLVGTRSATQNLTVTNTGSVTLAIKGVSLGGLAPGDFTTTDTCAGVLLSPASGCVIRIAFAPTATGHRSATVSIVDSAADSPQSASLTGSGLLAATSTPVPPTNTAVSPTNTAIPPTNTAAPPVSTSAASTNTPKPTTPPTVAPKATAPAGNRPTATSRHALSERLSVPNGGLLRNGSTLGVSVDNAPPRAAVAITTQLERVSTATQTTVVYVPAGDKARATIGAAACRKGMRGCIARTIVRRVTRTLVLYQTGVRAQADKRGHAQATVRLDYAPRKTQRLLLVVTVRTSLGSATRGTPVTILPARGHRK